MEDLGRVVFYVGIAAIVAGAVMASSLLPPNPVLGVRTRSSLASRAQWDRLNRVGGLAIAIAGAVTVALHWLIVHMMVDDARPRRVAMILAMLPMYLAARWIRRWARNHDVA